METEQRVSRSAVTCWGVFVLLMFLGAGLFYWTNLLTYRPVKDELAYQARVKDQLNRLGGWEDVTVFITESPREHRQIVNVNGRKNQRQVTIDLTLGPRMSARGEYRSLGDGITVDYNDELKVKNIMYVKDWDISVSPQECQAATALTGELLSACREALKN